MLVSRGISYRNYTHSSELTRLSLPSTADVMQEDVLLPTLTVTETLQYAACTRMEGHCDFAERQARVAYLVDLFGMGPFAHSLVGECCSTNFKDDSISDLNQTYCLSGERGEPGSLDDCCRKKLAIMVEIVAVPKVIFMDGEQSSYCIRVLLLVLTLIHWCRAHVMSVPDRGLRNHDRGASRG